MESTILELIDIIKDITGTSSKVVFMPLPEDDPRRRCPDINLARRVLGWNPETSLKEGLLKTVDYFEMLLSGKKIETGDPLL